LFIKTLLFKDLAAWAVTPSSCQAVPGQRVAPWLGTASQLWEDFLMHAQILNFKTYNSGLLIGFFDLSVNGLVVTGCKAFKKPTDNGEDRYWFGWPSEKIQNKDGNDQWRDIVTAAEPLMHHLQSQVRDQLRVILDGGVKGSSSQPSASKPTSRRFRTPEGDDLSEYRSRDTEADIPF
jgi:hypothetical protein